LRPAHAGLFLKGVFALCLNDQDVCFTSPQDEFTCWRCKEGCAIHISVWGTNFHQKGSNRCLRSGRNRRFGISGNRGQRGFDADRRLGRGNRFSSVGAQAAITMTIARNKAGMPDLNFTRDSFPMNPGIA
jgi:hypothetical protein